MKVSNKYSFILNEALFMEKFNTMPGWMKRFMNKEGVDADGNPIAGWTLVNALRYYFTNDSNVADPQFNSFRNKPGAESNYGRDIYKNSDNSTKYLLDKLNVKTIYTSSKWPGRPEDDNSVDKTQNWRYIYNNFTKEDPNKIVIFHFVSYYPPGHPQAGEQLDEAVFWPTREYDSHKNASFVYQTPLNVIKKLDKKNTSFHTEVLLPYNTQPLKGGIGADQARYLCKDIIYIDYAEATASIVTPAQRKEKLNMALKDLADYGISMPDFKTDTDPKTKNDVYFAYYKGMGKPELSLTAKEVSAKFKKLKDDHLIFRVKPAQAKSGYSGVEYANSDFRYTLADDKLVVQLNQEAFENEFYRGPDREITGDSYTDANGTERPGTSVKGVKYGQDRNRALAGTPGYDKSGYLTPDLNAKLDRTAAGKYLKRIINKFEGQLKLAEEACSNIHLNSKEDKGSTTKEDAIKKEETRKGALRLIKKTYEIEEKAEQLVKEVDAAANDRKYVNDTAAFNAELKRISDEYKQLSAEFNDPELGLAQFVASNNLVPVSWFDASTAESTKLPII